MFILQSKPSSTHRVIFLKINHHSATKLWHKMIAMSCYIWNRRRLIFDGHIHMLHRAWMVRLMVIPVAFNPDYTLPVVGLTFAVALLPE